MAEHTSVALQTKIYSLLAADATLIAMLANGASSINDNTPDNSEFPYIQIGEDTFGDWSAHDFDGFDGDITLHVWTQGRGRKECKQIQDQIYAVLHNIDLSLTGRNTVSFRCSLSETLLDPDGSSYHGVMKFGFLLGGKA